MEKPKPVPDNPYPGLCTLFREADAKFGHRFALIGYTGSELDLLPGGYERYEQIAPLGSIHLRSENASDYYVFAPRSCNPLLPINMQSDAYILQPYNRFHELSALAGAHLPRHVRDGLPVQPRSCIDLFLLFMWLNSPPPQENLDPGVGQIRYLWRSPFRAAADAIEQCGLMEPSGTVPEFAFTNDYAPADKLALEGIRQNAISADSRVRKIKAPKGYPTDSQGKQPRVLYHIDDARKYHSPKEHHQGNLSSSKRK